MAEDALILARKKLNFLNVVTFNDIRNSIFSLSGYLELEKELLTDEKVEGYLENEKFAVRSIVHSLNFAKNYQDMGIKPPLWQNVNQTFLYAISHLDFAKVSRILRKVTLDNLEIYADPLLETVFFNLAENVLKHGGAVTEMILRYQEVPEGLTLFFEDNGKGIPVHLKEEIFERGYGKDKGMGLFLVREVLGITRISIRETGQQGKGARFEISVPKGCYRFASR
jgi:signal transduction histidine kinase